MGAGRQLLADFLRAVVNADPMERQALLDEYTKRLDNFMKDCGESNVETSI